MNEIKTGDMIAVRTAHNILGKMTQFFTDSIYTHTGIAIWINGQLFLAELNGGRNHLVPMCQLDNYDVYAAPEGLENIEAAIFRYLEYQINYGFLAFIAIGFLNLMKIKMFVHWRNVMVCSGYCVAIYESAGWPEHTRVLSPGELASELVFKFGVRPLPKP